MASLAGGRFTMGERGDAVTVQPFCLDVTEVTVASYAACVLAGGCSAHGTWTSYSSTTGIPWSSEGCNYCVTGRGNHPMNCVDWNQAGDYCKAQGKRLPTEEEWEWAARGGTEGRTYPWGKAAPASASQLCWGDGTCPVGSFPKGDAPGGIHDLAGNVSEWTFQYAQAYSIARGGGWRLSFFSFSLSDYEALCKDGVSAADGGPPPVCREVVAPYQARSRLQMMPSRRAADLGFRCAW
jgi:sulfatase modifying factor 1